jgi:hypothetical protein
VAAVLIAALCCGSAAAQVDEGAPLFPVGPGAGSGDEAGRRRLRARPYVDRTSAPQIGASVMMLGKFDWEIGESLVFRVRVARHARTPN